MNFLQKVDFMMEKYGLNKLSLSQKSGIPYSTIVGWYKKGYEGLKLTTLRRLSEYFNTLLDFWVLDDVDDPNYGKANGFNLEFEETQQIIKYRALDEHGKEIVDTNLEIEYKRCMDVKAKAEAEAQRQATRAAVEMEAAEEIEPEPDNVILLKFNNQKASAGSGFILDYERTKPRKVLLNRQTRKADFCVEVRGNSMAPELYNGDILLIREQPTVDPGEIGLFIVDDCGYVKRMSEDGEELISINPDYDNIPLKGCDYFRCCGKVLGVLDPDWIVER